MDEAERSLHDALCVLTTHVRDKRVVPGAGASEMLTATAVMTESQKVKRVKMIKNFNYLKKGSRQRIASNGGIRSCTYKTSYNNL